MWPYFGIISILTISGLIGLDRRAKGNFNIAVLSVLMLLLLYFCGLRTIGWDYENYLDLFRQTPEIWHYSRTISTIEPGYELISSISKGFTHDYNIFLLIFTAINISLAMSVCVKYSPYPLISFFLFCAVFLFAQVMGQMRQPMATSLAYLILIPLVLNHHRVAAVVATMIVGMLFHKSLLFFAVVLPFAFIKLTSKQTILFIIATILLFCIPNQIKSIIMALIPGSFYLHDVIEAYMTYLGATFSFTFGMIERVGLLVFCYAMAKKYGLYQKDYLYRVLINIYFTGIVFYFAFVRMAAEFASRGTKPMYFSIILIFPILLKHAKGIDRGIIWIAMMAWSLYLFVSFVLAGEEEYFPYSNVLSSLI